ncbi:MAG: CHASE2 domain-containing protein, partial [Opitutaceae bacterium]
MGAKDNSRLSLLRWLCLAPIPILWCVIAHYGWLDFLENKFLDWRFRYRGEIAAPVKVNYIDIDPTSIDEIGGWPWDRANFHKVTKALIEQGGVKAIGIDSVLSELGISEVADRAKIKEGNKAFGRFLRGKPPAMQEPPVVLAGSFAAENYRDVRGISTKRRLPLIIGEDRKLDDIEPPELSSFDIGGKFPFNPPHVAIIDTLNGGTRWVPLIAPTMVQTYRHMSLELVRLYLGVPREGVLVHDDDIELVTTDGRTVARIPLFKKQHLEINWHSAWLSPLNPRTSFSVVLNNAEMLNSADPDENKRAEEQKTARAFFAQSDWKDSIVLIGPTDTLLQDLGTAPFDNEPVPKVGVHGNLVKTIISGNYLHRFPSWHGIGWFDFLIILTLTPLVASLAVTGGVRGVLWKVAA